MPPIVSIIIPTYNRSDLLLRAVNSVLSQSYTDYELIIVDDYSSDNTQEVISSFSDTRIISIQRERNGGLSAARNTGIEQARGEYIAFLDDDDEWVPEKLTEQVAFMDSLPPKVGMIYGWVDVFDDQGRLIRQNKATLRGDIFEEVLRGCTLCGCSGQLARASAVREIGGFDEKLRRGIDGDYIRRICQRYHVEVMPKTVLNYYTGHSRISDSSPKNLQAQVDSIKVSLRKFANEYEHRPRTQNAVLRQLSNAEILTGNFKGCLEAFLMGVRLDPLNPANITHAFRLVKTYLWHRTPLSRHREQAKVVLHRLGMR